MAPALIAHFLVQRQSLNNNYNNPNDCYYYSCSSTWSDWGRWVALAAIVVFAILVAFLFSCFNSRRRRRRGLQPMYGTGWMAKPQYGNNNYYPNQPFNGGAPAPPYEQQPGYQHTGNTFNSNDGYYGNHGYGGQQNGIELQQPQSAYQPQRGGDVVYDSPVGPPPGKKDQVIR